MGKNTLKKNHHTMYSVKKILMHFAEYEWDKTTCSQDWKCLGKKGHNRKR